MPHGDRGEADNNILGFRKHMSIINGERTLGDLRKAHSTKASFNKAMRMDAKKRCEEFNPNWMCKICGETREIDVCHIKPISEFSDEGKIKEINGPNNTILLCPLHHRLFDQQNINSDKLKENKYFGLGIHLIIDFPSSIRIEEALNLRNIIKNKLLDYIGSNNELNTILKEKYLWIDE